MKKVEIDFHGRPLSIEVGRMARQAGGSALVQYGDTVVLVTATAAKEARENIDFFPLTCDYQEKTFAAGKIPGGFFKREGRQSEKEILNSRLIDRPLRPLFPEGFRCETQIVATVLSFDKENDADMPALIGASAALQVSDIPFSGPIAGIRMGRIGGQLVVNPTMSQYGDSDLQLIVAGSRDAIVMVEGGAKMLSEDVILDALFTAHREMQKILDLQDELQKALGKPKRTVVAPVVDKALQKRVSDAALPKIRTAMATVGKHERSDAVRQVRSDLLASLAGEFPDREKDIKGFFGDAEYDAVRGLIVE